MNKLKVLTGTVPMSFLLELSDNGFSESEESDFWSDFDNP